MNIFTKAIASVRRRASDRTIDRWCAQKGMNLHSDYGFVIRPAGMVSEFGYLLRHYSDGKFSSFDGVGLTTLSEQAPSIIERAQDERDNPREHQNMGVGLPTAQRNLDCLVLIMRTIADYTKLCDDMGRQDRIQAGLSYGK